jgi:hypothetical protein
LPGWLRSAGPLSGPFPTNFDVHRLDPDDRLTSTPAVLFAQKAAIARRHGGRVKSTLERPLTPGLGRLSFGGSLPIGQMGGSRLSCAILHGA